MNVQQKKTDVVLITASCEVFLHVWFYSVSLSVKTLSSIMDDHMGQFYSAPDLHKLIKPFSLFILDGCLNAVSDINSKGWTDNDLHGTYYL